MAKNKPSSQYGRGLLCSAVCSMLLLGCESCANSVKVPPAGQDQAPTLILGTMLKAGQKPGEWRNVTQSGPLNLPTDTVNQTYIVSTSASNPVGGVKEIRLDIGQAGRVNKTITNSQTADTNGMVASSLAIPGTNGQGGVGPLAIEVAAGVNPELQATVTATNFNGQSTTMTVYFNVIPGPPAINKFSASPNDGYIYLGTPATLSWNVSCGIGSGLCNVSLRGADGVNYANQVLFVPALPLSGTFQVKPTTSTLTKYTLTVTNSEGGGQATKDLKVQLYNPNLGGGGQVFFFKMTGSSSVTNCFTIAVYSRDQATAKQEAESQNGGFTATSIDEQQFIKGC